MGYTLRAASPFPPIMVSVGRFATVCGAYLIAAKIGLSFYAVSQFSTSVWPPTALIWPPTGIALTALFFWGYGAWPGVAVGAFLVNLFGGAPLFVSGGITIGNTLEALAGVYILREIVGLNPLFERIRDSVGLIVTGMAVAVISATIGIASLVFGGVVPLSAVLQTWLVWWLGNSLSVLILAPFLLRWLTKSPFAKEPRQYIEKTIVFAFLVLADSLAFFNSPAQSQWLALAYIFLPLLWISFRTGMRGFTLANLVTALFILSSLVSGRGIFFAQGIQTENLIIGQLFIATIAIIFFILTTVIEERKEVERSLSAHVDTLEHVVEKISSEDQAKSDFLAILAHELRNPLAPIVSALELIKINGIRPENAKLFETLDTQVHTIERLLDDLLDTTRILHKKFKLQKEPVELQAVLNQSFESVRPFIKTRKHKLSTALPDKPIWIFGDPIRLVQIFVNVLNNASKYTEPGGKISVNAKREGSFVRVDISDTGIGISSEMLKRIFEPFVQANESHFEVGAGLGLGLALTKQLVELHGGQISVASDGKGKGSTFSVIFPVLDTAPLPIPGAKSSGGRNGSNGERHFADTLYDILVVDDNEVAAHVLQKLLEHNGHTVHVVHTGETALEYVRTQHPEVLILDIGLPDISGYEVATQLRQDTSAPLLLIALSGYGQNEDKLKAANAGFDYHLTKPVSVRDIEELLQKKRRA